MTTTLSLSPLRILVVENDPAQRSDLIQTLKLWGYIPHAAAVAENTPNAQEALLEDARQKARHYRCHIAIVDMRLKDDSNTSDTSGLALVSDLAPTISIIVSGYRDAETVHAAFRAAPSAPQRAYDFIRKEDGPEALRDTIREIEKEIWRRREVECIRPQAITSEALIRQFFPHDQSVPLDEVDDVLRRLFPKAGRLTIEAVNASQGPSIWPLTGHTVVLRVIVDNNAVPVLVKLAPSGQIRNELANFEAIRDNVGSLCYAEPGREPVTVWDVGGATYRFLGSINGDRATTFCDFYGSPGRTEAEIAQALDSFQRFWNLHAHQRPTAQPDRATVFRAYTDVWGVKWCKRLVEYQSHPLLAKYRCLFPEVDSLNPITWLVNRIELCADGKHNDSRLPSTQLAMTHGDLHGGNLFVDSRGSVWVIDYERTGFGPIVQDWVELEHDILTNLVEVGADEWPAYQRLLAGLLETDTIRLTTPTPAELGRFEKEWRLIGRLRALAADDADAADGQPYVWGLLFNALFRLTLLLRDYDELQSWPTGRVASRSQVQEQVENSIQRSLLWSGKLCRRLALWQSDAAA